MYHIYVQVCFINDFKNHEIKNVNCEPQPPNYNNFLDFHIFTSNVLAFGSWLYLSFVLLNLIYKISLTNIEWYYIRYLEFRIIVMEAERFFEFEPEIISLLHLFISAVTKRVE